MDVAVIGAGVMGLTAAAELSRRGAHVTLHAASQGADAATCSWWAGGMLAPDCELETAEPLIARLAQESVAFWQELEPAAAMTGTLVVALGRDRAELQRFAKRTSGWSKQSGAKIAALEPALSGRFQEGLFFAREGHLDPRRSLAALQQQLVERGVTMRLGQAVDPEAIAADWIVDCRGLAARDRLTDLRGVRGEMLILRAPELRLSRTLRLLHPRHPLYVVPRADGHFMLGATSLESEGRGPPSARAVMELLSAAYALHPAFAEAEVVELGADLRPAFPDNLPRLVVDGRRLFLNGAYRHGFLVAPALARRAAALIHEGQIDPEVTYDLAGERRAA